MVKGKKNPALTASLKPRLKPVRLKSNTPGPVDMLLETKYQCPGNLPIRCGGQNPSDISWSVSDKQVVSVKMAQYKLAPEKQR